MKILDISLVDAFAAATARLMKVDLLPGSIGS